MKPLQPVIVAHLFPEILDELLLLLSGLSAEEWARPTACASWSVKDVALHLLGDEVGNLSRRRDAHSLAGDLVESWEELVALIDDLNRMWVEATRRISPRLLCDLLRFTGTQMCEYFRSLDPDTLGPPVSWAGPEPAPVWLDLAREYTERWHHQQHIRDAVEKPGLKQPRYFAPVLDTFVRALPHTYRHVDARDGTLLALTISGPSGGKWYLGREGGLWRLHAEDPLTPDAEIVMHEEMAWRLFTRGVDAEKARESATIVGDRALGLNALETVSIIA